MIQKTRKGWGEIEQSLPQIAGVLFALGLFNSRHFPTIREPDTGYPRNSRSLLTSPHMMIPDSNAISNVSTSTGHPDRTELNTAFAEVPGGSSTTMNATPGDPIRGMNL